MAINTQTQAGLASGLSGLVQGFQAGFPMGQRIQQNKIKALIAKTVQAQKQVATRINALEKQNSHYFTTFNTTKNPNVANTMAKLIDTTNLKIESLASKGAAKDDFVSLIDIPKLADTDFKNPDLLNAIQGITTAHIKGKEKLKKDGANEEAITKHTRATIDAIADAQLQFGVGQTVTPGQEALGTIAASQQERFVPGKTAGIIGIPPGEDLTFKEAQQAGFRKPTPPKLKKWEVSPDGTMTFTEGGAVKPNTSLTKKTINTLQAFLTEANKETINLKAVQESFDENFYTVVTKAKAWGIPKLERLGFGGVIPKEWKQEAASANVHFQQIKRITNKYRHDITGANAVLKELDRLEKDLFSPGQSKTGFIASYNAYVKHKIRTDEMIQTLLNQGFKGDIAGKDFGQKLDQLFIQEGDFDVSNLSDEELLNQLGVQ